MESYPKAHPLDFELLRQELDSLIRAFIYKVDREFPKRLAHLSAFRECVLVCLFWGENTYRTIRYISADKPHDVTRRWSYMLAIPSLNRTVLDATFNLVYLFEDVDARFKWFKKAGFREKAEEYARHSLAYSGFAEWKDFLALLKRSVDEAVHLCEITPEELANPNLIERWPNPGKMPNFRIKKCQASPAMEYLQYLNDWFYRDTSQVSHLSFSGMEKVGAFILKEMMPEDLQVQIDAQAEERLRSINVERTLTLMLGLLSEIENYFRFGLQERLKYLWVLLANHSPETQELYDKRYATLLAY